MNTIGASLVIAGGIGYDLLDVNNAGDGTNAAAHLTNNSVTGLGMGGPVTYDAVEFFNLDLGAENNSLTVQDTHNNATRIQTGGGDNICQCYFRTDHHQDKFRTRYSSHRQYAKWSDSDRTTTHGFGRQWR